MLWPSGCSEASSVTAGCCIVPCQAGAGRSGSSCRCGPKLQMGASLAQMGRTCWGPPPASLSASPKRPTCPTDTDKPGRGAGRAWQCSESLGSALCQACCHQNSRAFFLRSFLFHKARRSNSSMLIPNTSWNSSGDRCLFKQGKIGPLMALQQCTHWASSLQHQTGAGLALRMPFLRIPSLQ